MPLSPTLQTIVQMIGAGLLSAALTGAWIAMARSRQIQDEPGVRRLHDVATPRGGGIGIVVVLLLTLSAWMLQYRGPNPATPLVIGVGLASLAGLLDDMYSLPSLAKLLLQALAAACIAWALPAPGMSAIGAWLLAGLFVLVVINFWNFMDGANGMVALQTIVLAAALAFFSGNAYSRALALLLLAACLGFLPFNFPKARVFLGDVGSHGIGAALAVLFLWGLREGDFSRWQALILVSAFGLDAGITLSKRMLQGRTFWRAHREHLFQMAIRRGSSHATISGMYAAWGLLAAAVAVALSGSSPATGAAAAGAVSICGLVVYFYFRRSWLRQARSSRNTQ